MDENIQVSAANEEEEEFEYDDLEIDPLEDISDAIMEMDEDSETEWSVAADDVESAPAITVIARTESVAPAPMPAPVPALPQPVLEKRSLSSLPSEVPASPVIERSGTAHAVTKKLPSLPGFREELKLPEQPASSINNEANHDRPESAKALDDEAAELKALEETLARYEQEEQVQQTKKPRGTAKLGPQESLDMDIKQTLGEMAFIEGNESLERGDRTSAISHYRDAVGYLPEKIDFCIKLAEVLAEEPGNWTEVETLMNKAIELAPKNMELRARLAEMREAQGRAKRGTQNLSMPSTPKRGTQKLDPGFAQAAAGDEQQGNTQELRGTRNLKGKGRRARFVSVESFNLPGKVSALNKVLMIVIVGIVVGSFYYAMTGKQELVYVKLVTPPDITDIGSSGLVFSWQSAGRNFLLRIEENGTTVLERSTQETQYRLTPSDEELLKPDHRYSWKIIPVTVNNEPLPHTANEFKFKVVAPPKKIVVGQGLPTEQQKKPQQTQQPTRPRGR